MVEERPHDPGGPQPSGSRLPRRQGEPETSLGPSAPGAATGTDGIGTGTDTTAVEAPGRQPTPLTQQIGRITVFVLAALFLVFALVNLQPVTFSWIFGESTAVTTPTGETTGGVPLILLLVTSFLMGAVVGAGLTWRRQRVRRRQRTAARV